MIKDCSPVRSLCIQIPTTIPYLSILLGLCLFSSIWLTMGLYHLGVLAVMLLCPTPPGRAAIFRGWRTGPGLALTVVCALSGVSIYLAFPWADATATGLADALAGLGVSGAGFWLLAGWYVAVTPWIEELFWRGRLASDRRGLDASDLLFAGYHVLVLVKFLAWPWTALAFASLVGAAWAWRWARRTTGGLAIPVATHAVADVSTMAAVWFLIR